jgi:hypothetical protein
MSRLGLGKLTTTGVKNQLANCRYPGARIRRKGDLSGQNAEFR